MRPIAKFLCLIVIAGQAGSVPALASDDAASLGATNVALAGRLSAAGGTTCAVRDDHTVRCWGDDTYGVVRGSSTVADASRVFVSFGHACALLLNGSITCWGADTAVRDVPVDLGQVKDLVGGLAASCVLRLNGTVRCWGNDDWGQVSQAYKGSDAVALSGGDGMLCALLSSGKATCWGMEDRATRVSGAVGLSGGTSIASGRALTCSVRGDRTLFCWGFQDGRFSGYQSESNVLQVATGSSPCVLHLDGTADCVGSYAPTGQINAGQGIRYLSAGDAHVCAVLMDMSVRCWGSQGDPVGGLSLNLHPSPPRNVRASAAGSTVTVSWDQPGTDGGAAIASYSAVAAPGGASCLAIAPATACDIAGLVRGSKYTFTVTAANELGVSDASVPISLVPGDRPAAPTNVTTSSQDRAIRVSWTPPSTFGDGPFRGYIVTSNPASKQCVAAAGDSSCQMSGLRNGVSYTFQVVAINDCGSSDPAVSPVAVSFSWPEAPLNLRLKSRTQAGVSVAWDASEGNGSVVTGYQVAISRDAGLSWNTVEVSPDARNEWTVASLSSASAAYVKVAGVNAAGAGPWSDALLVTSKGAKPVRVTVVDGKGFPVVGGAITWRMSDNSAWSARTYGLTDDGVIEFPMAPAGSVQVTLTGALTQDGARVSGTATTILGFNSAVVKLPATPLQARTTRVVMPNGMPVANASVSVDAHGDQYVDGACAQLDWDGSCLEYRQIKVPGTVTGDYTAAGFTFTVPVNIKDVNTDSNGEARFSGFFTGDPNATVVYNDGIIVQQQQVVLAGASTRVELDYMPWVEVAQSTVTADLNTAVPVTVSVAEPTYQSVARGFLPRSMKAGVTVTVIPPKGAPKGSCKAQMTGKTNSQGKVTLKVCATKSGVYGFKTSGAASVSTFKLFVKGTAPMPVTSVTARSLQVGSVRATWGAPLFDGKSPVVSYTVTASAKGKKTVTKTVKANVKHVTLDGLANATTYMVTITATTKKGTSDPVVVSVPVA